jgi:hypothetical protein
MTAILYPPARPQSVGEVLDTGFRIFTSTLLKCLPYAALAVISGQLPTLYDVAVGRSLLQATLRTQHTRDPVWWLLELVAIVLTMTLTNALLLRQRALATGGAAATGAELAGGLRRVLGLVLIAVLVVLATVVPVGIVAGFFAAAARAAGSVSLLILVVVLAIIPASWLLLRWSSSGTVYVLSERAPVDSMRHSWQLTAGNFWRLSIIYSVAIVLIVVLYVLSGVISGVASLVFARGDIAVLTATAAVVVVLLGAIATPFYSALALAVLGDLSVRKEGTDLAQRIQTPAMP